MEIPENLIHRGRVSGGESGELIQFSRQAVQWDWMSFSVRRLAAAASWECYHAGEETACVLLSRTCAVEWNKQRKEIGKRRTVFDGLPYALYLAPGDRARFTAISPCKIAEYYVPSNSQLPPPPGLPPPLSISLLPAHTPPRQ